MLTKNISNVTRNQVKLLSLIIRSAFTNCETEKYHVDDIFLDYLRRQFKLVHRFEATSTKILYLSLQ